MAVQQSTTYFGCSQPAPAQVVDVTNLALQYACAPPGNATQQQLDDAANWAASQPPRAINTNGTGLSSRPGSPNKLWLDFLGSSITGTGVWQQQAQEGPPPFAARPVQYGLKAEPIDLCKQTRITVERPRLPNTELR
jgi:hypothetical protein